MSETISQYETFVGPLPEEAYLRVTREFNMFRQDRIVELAARALYGETQAQKLLLDYEKDKYDDISGLLKGAIFRREANARLLRLDPQERRMLLPNNAIIGGFDAKGLKKVNDSMGHEAGNRMLFTIGQIIKKVARETDLAGRMGDKSDEYAALFFFRDDQISVSEMEELLNSSIMSHVKKAVDNQELAGLRWRLAPFIIGLDIRQHLELADPIPGTEGVIEYPSAEVLPARA